MGFAARAINQMGMTDVFPKPCRELARCGDLRRRTGGTARPAKETGRYPSELQKRPGNAISSIGLTDDHDVPCVGWLDRPTQGLDLIGSATHKGTKITWSLSRSMISYSLDFNLTRSVAVSLQTTPKIVSAGRSPRMLAPPSQPLRIADVVGDEVRVHECHHGILRGKGTTKYTKIGDILTLYSGKI